MSLVDVRGLTVSYGPVRAVDDLTLTLAPGAALGLVGESGSGKSTVAAALLGLHRGTGATVSGSVLVAGTDVGAASDDELRRLRGARAAMVFQDPLSSLDPYYAVGDQIAEVYRAHTRSTRRAARARATAVLDRVGIADAARRSRARPHEFSGGMRQRVLIAMALACAPDLLVADEPTTALDVTVQAQILDLLHTLRQETGMGLLLVTHDVGVAAESVDDVLVMRHGRAVERGPVSAVLTTPAEPYTRELLSAVPRVDTEPPPRGPARGPVVLSADRLTRVFGRGARALTAVDDVSLTLRQGETLGVVGESGSGKTTLGRMLVGLLAPSGGTVSYGDLPYGDPSGGDQAYRDGDPPGGGRETGQGGAAGQGGAGGAADPARTRAKGARPGTGTADGDARRGTGTADGGARRGRYAPSPHRGRPLAQMVFQDPVSSLNPRRSIGESIADPLRARGERDEARIRARVSDLLDRVGLDPAHHDRYPHEFSGGQRQRVGIARALAPDPRLVVCDEPVSALDVTTQAQVTALLAELQRELGLALVFIAHDLAVVRQVSDRVAVMHRGRVVEYGTAADVYGAPTHPYTRRLLGAVPSPDPATAAARRTARRAPARA